MRFNLRIKIFFILLATSLTIICAMLFFMLFYFEIGFSGYVEEVEIKRIETLSRQLGKLYSPETGFGFLKTTPELASSLENLIFDDLEWIESDKQEEVLPNRVAPKFSLFFVLDKDKQLIFGHRDSQDSSPLIPIKAVNALVGWVGVYDAEITYEADQSFIRDLSWDFLMVAGFITLFSALAAMIGAVHFQKPIQILVRRTRDLTSGDYSARVPEDATDELGDLSRDFNILARTLEENEAARKKWVEDISHELKTPLTLMSGELEAVRDGVRELTPETLDLLSRDIAHLTALVNDLNELWKSETGKLKLDFTQVNLQELLNRSAEKFTTRFSEKQISLSLPEQGSGTFRVNGDKDRLCQVFDNLFQNAVRYTDTGGQIRVRIQKTDTTGRVNLEDSSPGVPAHDFENIFKRLYRVEPSRNRALGGAGIGLAVCMNILKAHKGTIRAYPSPLGGLGIQIELPLVPKRQK